MSLLIFCGHSFTIPSKVTKEWREKKISRDGISLLSKKYNVNHPKGNFLKRAVPLGPTIAAFGPMSDLDGISLLSEI